MPSDCPITEDEINALVDGELAGREQRRVAAHIVTCSGCSEAAGGLLAEKRLLSARSQAVETPSDLWARVAVTLDTLDGLAKASRPPARRPVALGSTPALATIGCLLIVGALVVRSQLPAGMGQGAMFARAHLAACQRAVGGGDVPSVSDVVAPGLGLGSWDAVERAVFSLNGQYVEHTLYRFNRTPISEFVLATQALSLQGVTSVRYDGAVYLVRGEPGGSLVAWEAGGIARVLAARVKVPELLSAAAARRAVVPLLRAY